MALEVDGEEKLVVVVDEEEGDHDAVQSKGDKILGSK